TPRKVAELDQHRLIGYTANPEMNRWPLRNPGSETAYQVRGYTNCDNTALILTLAREGVGVGRLMDLLVAPLIRDGDLVALLQDEIASQYVPIHALMLQERHRLPKIRACIDYWAQRLGTVQAASAAVSKAATDGARHRSTNAPSESTNVNRRDRQKNP